MALIVQFLQENSNVLSGEQALYLSSTTNSTSSLTMSVASPRKTGTTPPTPQKLEQDPLVLE
jgi:hypothetical protein